MKENNAQEKGMLLNLGRWALILLTFSLRNQPKTIAHLDYHLPESVSGQVFPRHIAQKSPSSHFTYYVYNMLLLLLLLSCFSRVQICATP